MAVVVEDAEVAYVLAIVGLKRPGKESRECAGRGSTPCRGRVCACKDRIEEGGVHSMLVGEGVVARARARRQLGRGRCRGGREWGMRERIVYVEVREFIRTHQATGERRVHGR